MSGLPILILLVLGSSIPAIAVYLWFRIARYPFSTVWFLLSVMAGAAAFFPALILQNLIPANFAASGRWGILGQIFIHVAFTEELSRLIVLLILFFVAQRIEGRKQPEKDSLPINETHVIVPPPSTPYTELVRGAAMGLIAGLGFSLLESAVYGASDTRTVLLRIFTAAPLHAACGTRVGSAAVLFRTRPAQAIVRFITAVAIHGFYNFMIAVPGIPSVAAVLIAVSAAASSVLSIHSGMRGKDV